MKFEQKSTKKKEFVKKKFWIRFGVMCAIVAAILVLDLVTKYVFDATLGNETVSVIPYLFNFKLVHNYGAAWGMLAGKQVFLIVLEIVYLAIFAYYYVSISLQEKSDGKNLWLVTVACAFISAGGLGNLYDRIVFGYVRDFIQFDFWQTFPVFNFADVALCVGVVLFVIYLVIYLVKDHKKKAIKIEKPEEDELSSDKQKSPKLTEKKTKKSSKSKNVTDDSMEEFDKTSKDDAND